MLTRHQVTFCVTYYAVGSACVLIATASYPDTSPFFFFLPMVHCASSPVTRVFALASVPNTKHLRRWESSDTEQVACSRRSVRGDAWNRLLNMSFIIKLVWPRQMFFSFSFLLPLVFWQFCGV